MTMLGVTRGLSGSAGRPSQAGRGRAGDLATHRPGLHIGGADRRARADRHAVLRFPGAFAARLLFRRRHPRRRCGDALASAATDRRGRPGAGLCGRPGAIAARRAAARAGVVGARPCVVAGFCLLAAAARDGRATSPRSALSRTRDWPSTPSCAANSAHPIRCRLGWCRATQRRPCCARRRHCFPVLDALAPRRRSRGRRDRRAVPAQRRDAARPPVVLPEPDELAMRVAAAQEGLPFRAGAFQPFIDDVAAKPNNGAIAACRTFTAGCSRRGWTRCCSSAGMIGTG